MCIMKTTLNNTRVLHGFVQMPYRVEQRIKKTRQRWAACSTKKPTTKNIMHKRSRLLETQRRLRERERQSEREKKLSSCHHFLLLAFSLSQLASTSYSILRPFFLCSCISCVPAFFPFRVPPLFFAYVNKDRDRETV